MVRWVLYKELTLYNVLEFPLYPNPSGCPITVDKWGANPTTGMIDR